MTHFKILLSVLIFMALSHSAYSSDSVLEGEREKMANSGERKILKRKLFSAVGNEKENNRSLFQTSNKTNPTQQECGKRKRSPLENFGRPALRPKEKKKKGNQVSFVTQGTSFQHTTPTKLVNIKFPQQRNGPPDLASIEGINIPQQIESGNTQQPDDIHELPKPTFIKKKPLPLQIPQFDEFVSYENVLEKIKFILEEQRSGNTVLILDCHGTLIHIKDGYTTYPGALAGAKEFLISLEALKKNYLNFYFLASSAYTDQKNVIETLQKWGLSTFFVIPSSFEIETIDEKELTYKKCGLFCSAGVKDLSSMTTDRYPYKALVPKQVFPDVDFDTFILLDDQAKVHREFQEICLGGTIKARVVKKSSEKIWTSEKIEIKPSIPSLTAHHNILFSHPSLNDDDFLSD